MTRLSFGGWSLVVDCEPPWLAASVVERYRPFLDTGNTPPDLVIDVTFVDGPCHNDTSDVLLHMPLERHGEMYIFDGIGISATISLTRERATLRLCSHEPLRDLEYFLRVVIAVLSYQKGGMLIHGAGLVSAGRMHLFIGQSGSGKSTVVQLSQHAIAVSDDLVLMRPEGPGWRVYGTPFWNPEADNRSGQTFSAALVGVYKLIQAADDRLEPMTIAGATAELVANCPVVNGMPDLLPGLLTRCRQVATTVPVQRLHFRKDKTFWRVLEPACAD